MICIQARFKEPETGIRKGTVMNIRAAVIAGCLVVLFAASFCSERGLAGSPDSEQGYKVGVVSVRQIFTECKRNAKYRAEAMEERAKMEAELRGLSTEIEQNKGELEALKLGSSDYDALMKEILGKQAHLQAQQEYFKQQVSIRERQLIEKLFKDVVAVTAEVAKDKGLDLVLEKSEPELSNVSSSELTLAISTHKVLYSEGCEDITQEVLARLDAMEQ